MVKVGVVVLNYKKYIETQECVESILKQKNIDLHVVIVENGSGNESWDYLQKRYGNCINISLIKSETNLGYAKGNNLGIKLLRKDGYEYIFIANSDIYFSSEDIISDMVNVDNKKDGVLIPIIRNLDGTIEQRVTYIKKMFALRIIKNLSKILFMKREKRIVNNEFNEINKTLVGEVSDRYVFSGSAYMLTPSFFKNYACLFPKTFLYCEEIASLIYVHKARLTTRIVDTKEIIHKGAASTPEDGRDGSKIKEKLIKQSAKRVFPLIFMSRRRIAKKYR